MATNNKERNNIFKHLTLGEKEKKEKSEKTYLGFILQNCPLPSAAVYWIAKTPGRANCLAFGLSRTSIPWPPPSSSFFLSYFYFIFSSSSSLIHPPLWSYRH
jgi:hypothetical protein